MRYLGSKASTAEIICRLVANYVSRGTFCDPFGGIGVVGAVFKQYGYTVWSGDILRNAYNFQVARLERQKLPSFRRVREILILPTDQDVVDYLNSAVQRGGWFEREYAKEGPDHRIGHFRPLRAIAEILGRLMSLVCKCFRPEESTYRVADAMIEAQKSEDISRDQTQ